MPTSIRPSARRPYRYWFYGVVAIAVWTAFVMAIRQPKELKAGQQMIASVDGYCAVTYYGARRLWMPWGVVEDRPEPDFLKHALAHGSVFKITKGTRMTSNTPLPENWASSGEWVNVGANWAIQVNVNNGENSGHACYVPVQLLHPAS